MTADTTNDPRAAPPPRVSSPASGAPDDLSSPALEYRGYTVARYNASIQRLAKLKRWYATALVATIAVASVTFVGVRLPVTEVGRTLQWLTLVWLLPVPILAMTIGLYFTWFRVERFALRPLPPAPSGPTPLVIFQVTSTGLNVDTVLNTVRSSLYWTRSRPDLGYRSEVWLVVEEWGYLPNRERLDVLAAEGARVVVTPLHYRTAKGTTRKGRALQYAAEVRRDLGVPLDRVFVYHQDDETAVGEDTVLGIDEFVRAHGHEKCVGCGIILYPQHGGDLRPSQVAEFGRTKDDIRTLFTITSRHNLFSGFHGSHYVARADVEEETSWDVGPDMTSEDLIFETNVRWKQGPIFHLLKGFAYEQAALHLRDQLTQRRRWFQGWWRAVLHQPFPFARKLVMTYGMLVWMSAILSVTAMVLSWVFGFSAIFVYTGALTGFVWASMVSGFHQGYVLHRAYLPRRSISLARFVLNGIVGGVSPLGRPHSTAINR